MVNDRTDTIPNRTDITAHDVLHSLYRSQTRSKTNVNINFSNFEKLVALPEVEPKCNNPKPSNVRQDYLLPEHDFKCGEPSL